MQGFGRRSSGRPAWRGRGGGSLASWRRCRGPATVTTRWQSSATAWRGRGLGRRLAVRRRGEEARRRQRVVSGGGRGAAGAKGSGSIPIQIGRGRRERECEGRVGDREESGAVRVSVGWTGAVSRLGRGVRLGRPGGPMVCWAVAQRGGGGCSSSPFCFLVFCFPFLLLIFFNVSFKVSFIFSFIKYPVST